MKPFIPLSALALALVAAPVQAQDKAQFEVASIRINPPQSGFHLAGDAVSGGPGTNAPGAFRCSKCSLATLIATAFDLQPYQFPTRRNYMDGTYEVVAKVPEGASKQQFQTMLQNLLKERFGLTWHFQDKTIKGYRLTVAKGGSKLQTASGAMAAPAGGQHGPQGGGDHGHSGAMVFGSTGMYRATGQTTAELAKVIADQIGLPVEDATGLTGKYDISLRWSGAEGSHGGAGHSDGGGSQFGGAGHGGHDGGGAAGAGGSLDAANPGLFDAVQQQLGLKLVTAEQVNAKLIVIDHAAARPTEN